ncbi:hypothetical protein P2318_33005 [Myxococcaceae bacterium GXIMD 01537]
MSHESSPSSPELAADGARTKGIEPPSREVLLGFLDSELTLIAQQQTNNGWTGWAITGAIGALAWMLIGQWESGWPSGRRWALAYVTLAMGLRYGWNIIQALDTKSSIPGSKTRFFLGSNTPSIPKAAIAFGILQDILFLGLLFWCPTSTASRFWLTIWLSLATCLWLLVFILSYTRQPFEANTGVGGPALRWLLAIHLSGILLVLIPVSLLGTDLLNAAPTAADIKAGGLLATLHFLAYESLLAGGRRPLMENLLRIRRELALGGISPQDAARYTEIEFLGLRVSDVFQEEAQAFLARADSLSKRCEVCVRSLDAALASMGMESKLPQHQQLGLLSPVLETCARQATDIHQSLTLLHADYSKIESRTRRISTSEDSRNATEDILAKLSSRYAEIQINYSDIQTKLQTLLGVVAELSVARSA